MNAPQSLLKFAFASTAVMGIVALPHSALAASFGTGGIKFDQDTTIDFTFVESHGAYKSTLSIFQVQNGQVNPQNPAQKLFWEQKATDNNCSQECIGTFGNAVTSTDGKITQSFTFKAGLEYTLGLLSGVSTVYSTTALNPAHWNPSNQQAVFGSNLLWGTGADGKISRYSTSNLANSGSYTSSNPFAGSVTIGFDDTGNNYDRDFNDFVVTAQARTVPEPMALAGLALVAGSFAVNRRRKQTV